jgi:hypothetical protein
MYPRTNYEMTQEQLDKILEACKPVPAMMIGGFAPSSAQENANNAWAALGREMGFDHMTVQPISGKGIRFFSAVPNETEEAKTERIKREAEDKRKADIDRLQDEIYDREQQLNKLLAEEAH